jgi:hypothetical protein
MLGELDYILTVSTFGVIAVTNSVVNILKFLIFFSIIPKLTSLYK